MKRKFELDENDIKQAIAHWITQTQSIADFDGVYAKDVVLSTTPLHDIRDRPMGNVITATATENSK